MITLHCENLTKALHCIAGTAPTTPSIIKEAEHALLTWENSDPSSYAVHLLQILTTTITTASSSQTVIPRLAAALSLKAMVGRKWKDRGRLSKKTPLVLIDKDTKQQIRTVLLSMLTTGAAPAIVGTSTNANASTGPVDHNLYIALLRDKTLMTTIASTLSKIASFDLPLEFKELVPTLVGYSLGSSIPSSPSYPYEPIDPSVSIETRINTANALEFVLSDLSKKRLLLYKKYMISISSTYLPHVVSNGLMYSMNHLTNGSSVDQQYIPIILQYSILMTKIVHHLILSSLSSLIVTSGNTNSGNKNHTTNENAVAAKAVDNVFELLLEYIPLSCKQLREMMTQQTESNNNEPMNQIGDGLKTLLEEFYDLVVATQKLHPISFSRYIGPFLTLFYNEMKQLVSTKNDMEAMIFAIPQMTFFANVISCSHYIPDENFNESMETWRSQVMTDSNNHNNTNENLQGRAISAQGDVSIDPNSVNAAVQSVWSFLTLERIHMLVDVSLFFITLNESHLVEWADDPESFFIERKNAIADDDVIACAQNMYLSLLESKCKSIVVEKISSLLLRVNDQIQAAQVESSGHQIDNNDNHNNFENQYATVVFWDAAYTAIGLSLDALKSIGLDVNNWFSASLSQVMTILMEPRQDKVGKVPVLRYRMLWLLECGFSHLNQSRSAVETLVAIIMDHSNPQNDAVVKLAAVQALTTITYDPPEDFISFLYHPDKLITSLYNLTNEFQEVESKTDSLLLIQQVLTTFMILGQSIDNEMMMDVVVRPLEHIWNSSVDQYLILRSSVISILGCVASFGKHHSITLHPIALPLMNHALDPNNDDNFFLIADALDLWVTLLRLAVSYDSNFCVIFGRIEELLRIDLEHVRKLMLITEGYILIGGKSFWDNHAASLESIVKLLIGNLSMRGIKYLNLVFEALLKRFPLESSSMLLSSGAVTAMSKSCAETFANEQNCEPIQVIHIYLSIISRVILAFPDKIGLVAESMRNFNNFGLVELIHFYFKEFREVDPFRQKLWAMSLLTVLLSPILQNSLYQQLLNSDNFNKLLLCFLTVLEEDSALSPFKIGYDSEEEALNIQQECYDHLINMLSTNDIVFTTDARSLHARMMQEIQSQVMYQGLLQSLDQNLINRLNQICR